MILRLVARIGHVASYITLASVGGMLLVWLLRPMLLDGRFLARFTFAPAQPLQELVVIALDEEFGEHYNFPEVPSRDYLARLVRIAAEARVIMLDYKFNKADEGTPGYDSLCAAVEKAGNMVFPSRLLGPPGAQRQLSIPPEDLQANALVGYADLWGNPVHRMRLQATLVSGQAALSFTLAGIIAWHLPASTKHNGALVDAVAAMRTLNDSLRFPGSLDASFYINYRGPVESGYFTVYPSETVLRWPAVFRNRLRDKLVLIGSTYPDPNQKDRFTTPFGIMQGVEVHANILQSLLERDYLKRLGLGSAVLLSAVMLLLVTLSFRNLSRRRALAVSLGALLFYVVVSFPVFIVFSLILPMKGPMLLGMAGLIVCHGASDAVRFRSDVQSFEPLDVRLMAPDERAVAHPAHACEPGLTTYCVEAAPGSGSAQKIRATTSLKRDADFEQALKKIERGDTNMLFLKNFGRHLAERLFPEPVYSFYHRRLQLARRGGWRSQGLHLRLHIDMEALWDVPWELLYDRRAGGFLAASGEVLLTRYVGAHAGPRQHREPTHAASPKANLHTGLKVLIVCSDPRANSLKRLGLLPWDMAYEKELISSALKNVSGVTCSMLHHATPEALTARLREGFDVVHFVGATTRVQGQPHLIMENKRRTAVPTTAETFTTYLANAPTLSMLMLELARPPTIPDVAGVAVLAQRLVAGGLASVITFPVPISDAATKQFVQVFYQEMARGRGVVLAVHKARMALRERVPSTRAFSVPVHYALSRSG